jgi:DNA-binding response OmpR family regulator
MARPNKPILVIEDDPDITRMLELSLGEEGYTVDAAADGESGLARLAAQTYGLVLLDLMLPGMDGLDVCRRIRAQPAYTPIIILSSKSAEAHKVLGLELGADDYVTKPFSVVELAARIRTQFRRMDLLARGAAVQPESIDYDRLRIEPAAREVWLDGRPVPLTVREFDLLHFFARQPGRVFSRLELLNQVWGYNHDGYEHTVNSHINRLRAKIEPDAAHPRFILTVWGVGYKFAAGDES